MPVVSQLSRIDLRRASAKRRAKARLGRGVSRLVDPFIVSPFDRTGLRIHSLAFQAGDMDVDLAGKRCLVTGPNSDGRVIWVSSGGMYTSRLSLDDPNWIRRGYDGVIAYAEAKRAQVVLSEPCGRLSAQHSRAGAT